MISAEKLLFRIRRMILLFIVLLVLSGVTAFPVYQELQWASGTSLLQQQNFLGEWLRKVWAGVQLMHDQYNFLFYGYDWLAFAHLVIAMAFIGPYKDPVQNKWVIEWGMLACMA